PRLSGRAQTRSLTERGWACRLRRYDALGDGPVKKGVWSGRRDSNPRPSPWQGDALPTEPLPLDDATTLRWCREPGSNWRHRDFQSRALPTELSRPDGQPGLVARRRGRGYHGPPTGLNLA